MKVWLRTFGCRANQYDSETVRAMVERGGGTIVPRPEEADVAVFNSCAVTAEAEAELRKGIRRVARVRPGVRTVVMGCASARDHGALRALPTVEAVVAGADYPLIAAALALPPESLGPARVQGTTRGLLRIQDGCDEHCTFCATTLARGANRSRHADAIVDEARALGERHREIVLTGVHIGTWGADIGSSLGALVERLVREVPAVRFRLSSVEATEVDARLAELFSDAARLAPHLHAPLQSGSDAVLRRMGRHWYTRATYAFAIERLVAGRSTFAIGADVIAGFPGESAADHSETIALLESLPVTYLHVFPFSLRPGTGAERLPGHLPGDVVQQRARELRALGERKARRYAVGRAGGLADVVVLRGDVREGLTEDYLSVVMSADVVAGRGSMVRTRLSLGADGSLSAVPPESFLPVPA